MVSSFRTLRVAWILLLVEAGTPGVGAQDEQVVDLKPMRVAADVPLVKVGEFPMRESRFAPAVVCDGEYIYILGGSGRNGQPLRSIERFDLRTGEAEHFGELRRPRLWHRAVCHDGKILVLGGMSPLPAGTSESGAGSRSSGAERPIEFESLVEAVDLETGRAEEVGRMPDARAEFGCVVLADKLYVLGGKHRPRKGLPEVTNRVEVYDLTSHTWEQGASLPAAAVVDATLVDGPFIVVAGGYDGRRKLDHVFSFNPSSAAWTQLPALARSSSAHATVFLGRHLFLFGNYDAPGEIQVYDLVTKTAETFTLQYTPARHAGVVAAGGRIFVIGGKRHRWSSPLDRIQVFAPVARE